MATAMKTHPHSQSGVALIISLVLLVILTLLGLAGMRTTSMQEKMTGAMYQRSIAFQAAESASAEAEARILATNITGDPYPYTRATFSSTKCVNACTNNCTNGWCSNPAADQAERWQQSNFASWATSTTDLGSLVDTPPQYYIESMGPSSWQPSSKTESGKPVSDFGFRNYRITSRATLNGSTIIVQTTVILPEDI